MVKSANYFAHLMLQHPVDVIWMFAVFDENGCVNVDVDFAMTVTDKPKQFKKTDLEQGPRWPGVT